MKKRLVRRVGSAFALLVLGGAGASVGDPAAAQQVSHMVASWSLANWGVGWGR
jgi:hypothetical protein